MQARLVCDEFIFERCIGCTELCPFFWSEDNQCEYDYLIGARWLEDFQDALLDARLNGAMTRNFYHCPRKEPFEGHDFALLVDQSTDPIWVPSRPLDRSRVTYVEGRDKE